jgi:TRAP-type C4-dicarboxylate transport system substrate-binding protein
MKVLGRVIVLLLVFMFSLTSLEWLMGDEDDDSSLLKFGTLAPDNTPWSEILKDFKKRLQKETREMKERGEIKENLKVKLYLNGIKGDEKAMLEQIRYKKLTGGGFSTGGMSSVVPELQVFEVPFLFNNDQEADYIMDQVVLEDMQKHLEDRGLVLFCWAINGWYDFGSKKVQVKNPQDLGNCKIYTQESPVQSLSYEVLGRKPIPLAVTEVLSGLQTGMVDTYASTPIYALAGQWFTETKYWTDSDHVYQPAAVVFGKHWWEPLDQKVKDLILSFRGELQQKARDDVRRADDAKKFASRDDEIMETFTKLGITLEKLSPEQREDFKKQSSPLVQRMIQQGAFSQELWDKIQNALKKHR